MSKRRLRIDFNSPAVLGFVILCTAAYLVNLISGGAANRLLFSVYRSSLLDPLFYIRLFGHVLGHASWDHLLGNMMYILILGPMIEEKYGTENTFMVIALTAFATGLINVLFFPGVALLGASGVVFAFILLSSITGYREGAIPVTFLLVAVLYIGQQIAHGITDKDQISQMAHIVGGSVGAILGFLMNRFHMHRIR